MPPSIKVSTIKPIVHLFSGFLGVGKTTALKSLIQQKKPEEQWVILVNEFGEIGIDGAVLSNNGIPVAEIAGGCLCCVAGAQMTDTLQRLLRDQHPHRVMIEASGLAHAAGVIDELKDRAMRALVHLGAVFTVIDPRQFVSDDFFSHALYRDQVSVADVLVANKTDLCDEHAMRIFRQRASQLFPPKAKVVEVQNAQLEIAWLDTEVVSKSRYRLPMENQASMGFQAQGFTFSEACCFDGGRLTHFFNELPTLVQGLVRAKGVFQVMGAWVWLNWVDGQWGSTPVAWRRDSRFEVIGQNFDTDEIERRLRHAIQ